MKPEVRSQKSGVRTRNNIDPAFQVWLGVWKAGLAVLLTSGFCLLTPAFSQTPATTTIEDTVYRSDGTVASGTVVIKWPAFVTGDGRAVFGGTKTVPLKNGELAVALAPNAGGSPAGTSYNVRYFQSGGVFFEETWVVPTSLPLSAPAAPSVVTAGTPGGTTYYYWVTAMNAGGETLLSASGVVTTANSTLNTNNYNQVSWSAVNGATSYRVYRTNNGNAPSGTGNYLVGETTSLLLNDQSNTLSAATVPALNTTDSRTLSDVRVLSSPSPSVTLAPAQVQGNAIVSNPSSTQTIVAPSGNGVPLQITGRNNNNSNVFEIYDNQNSPALQSWFSTSGALQSSKMPTFSPVTAGSLLFGGSGGALSQDNTKLFWDSAAKRLQVGTRTGFDANVQSYLDGAQQTRGLLNGLTSNIFAGDMSVIQDNTTNNGYSYYGVMESTHSSGTRTDAIAVEADAIHDGAGGTVTTLAGVGATAGVVNGTATNAAGVHIFPNFNSGTITNNYGLFIDDQEGVGTNNWAIKTGTGKVQFGGMVLAKALNQVQFADQFGGGDAGAKITAAIAALPATGGVVDARGLTGAQVFGTNPFIGVTKPVHLILGTATYTVSVNVTAPANVALEFSHGSILSVNSGVAWTIAGPILAPISRIFAGSGTVAISSVSIREMYPQWWGAVGDDATDSTAALQACINASSQTTHAVCFLPGGVYRFSGNPGLTIMGQATLSGDAGHGKAQPRLHYTGTGTAVRLGNASGGARVFAPALRRFMVSTQNPAAIGLLVINVSVATLDRIAIGGDPSLAVFTEGIKFVDSGEVSALGVLVSSPSGGGFTGSTGVVFDNIGAAGFGNSDIYFLDGHFFGHDVAFEWRQCSKCSVTSSFFEQTNYAHRFDTTAIPSIAVESAEIIDNQLLLGTSEPSYTARKAIQVTATAGKILKIDKLNFSRNRVFLSGGVQYPLRFDAAAGGSGTRVDATIADNYVNLANSAIAYADAAAVKLNMRGNFKLGPGGVLSGLPNDADGSGVVLSTWPVSASSGFPLLQPIPSGAFLAAGSTGNTMARPAVGATRIAGEIAGTTNPPGNNEGFLRLSAGGGTDPAEKAWMDFSGFSTVGDMNKTIAAGIGTSEKLRINSAGVGIGTANPDSALHVAVAASATALTIGGDDPSSPTDAILNGQGTGILRIRRNGSPLLEGGLGASGDTLLYAAPGTERVRIKGDTGNVGIGVTGPSQKLEVNGGARLNTATARPTCSASTRGTFWFTQNGAGVKDDVAVCAKDAADAYAWRVIY